MSPVTKRGRAVITAVTVAVVAVGVVVAALVFGGRSEPVATPPASPSPSPSPSPPPPPPICPLSGVEPEGDVPTRAALAVKVENSPAGRPQTGMSWADIVYEEPVEGGITRFIAVYQCQDAGRIEPVRSARLSDVDILVQLGRPLFGYAGGVEQVMRAIRRSPIVDVNVSIHEGAYHRDPDRPMPYNLYTSTEELYGLVPEAVEPPGPVFTYSDERPDGPRTRSIHVPFSGSSDVRWEWDRGERKWLRSHGANPHTYSDGSRVAATNVIVQVVEIELTDVIDAAGNPSPKVVSVGGGDAFVFRDGRVIEGRWERDSLEDVTVFVDEEGNEISLRPGQTWVELVPTDVPVSFE